MAATFFQQCSSAAAGVFARPTMIFLILVAFPTNGAFGGDSQVMLDAVVLPMSERQPTWIGLRRKPSGRWIHVRVGRSLISLKPGTYRIAHLDFGIEYGFPSDTIYFEDSDLLTFEVFRGMTTLVGVVQVEMDKKPGDDGDVKHDIHLSGQEDVVSWACKRKDWLVEERPVAIFLEPGKYKTVNVNCAPSPPEQ